MFSTYFDDVSFLGFVKSSLGHSSSESSSGKGLRRVKKTVCLLSQCVLEWHEYTIKNFHFWNSCNIETWSCCFSKRCIWTNPSLRILNFHASGKHFAILVPSIPMNSAVNFSFILIIMSESFHQFGDFGWKSIFLVEFVGGNINALPFSNKSSMVHGMRRNQFLHRMSFLDAGFVQLCSRSFVFFCNSSLSRSDSLLVGLGPGSIWGNPSTKRFCPRQMTTHDVLVDEDVDGLWMSVP